MITFATLCYLRRGDRVLLLRKERGLFGEGKWNAPGGKMLLDELPETATVREMREETGLKVSGLQFHGILNFYLGGSRNLDQAVFVFSSKDCRGKLRRGREGDLKWFSVGRIPYDQMWPDDKIWLPLMLEGKSFVGDFYFTKNYAKLINYNIYETTSTNAT
jgi:8-oxo-dGTP diphosphatase